MARVKQDWEKEIKTPTDTIGSGGKSGNLSKGTSPFSVVQDKIDPPDYQAVVNNEPMQRDAITDYQLNLSAKELLDANVMTQISNEIARKNMSSDLAAMGLANSGYAGTASALRENANQAQLMQNQRAYNDAIMRIENEGQLRNEEALATEASNITSDLANLSQDGRKQYLVNNGFSFNKETGLWENPRYSDTILRGINNAYYVANDANNAAGNGVNEQNMQDFDSMFSGMTADQREQYLTNTLGLKYQNGKWVNGKNSSFTEAQLAHINNAYTYTSALDEQEAQGVAPINMNASVDDLLKVIQISGSVGADNQRWGIRNELADFINTYKNNPPKEGFVVRLTNQHSDNHAVLVYRNGQWVQGTDADWESADETSRRLFKEGHKQD